MFRSTTLIRHTLKSLSTQFRFLKCSSNGIRLNKFNDNDNQPNDRRLDYRTNSSNDLDDGSYRTFRSRNYNQQQSNQRFNNKDEEEDDDDLDELVQDDDDLDLIKMKNRLKDKKLDKLNIDEELLSDELILKVNKCDNISALLKTIKNEIDHLTPKQLEFIFIKFNGLCSASKRDRDDPENGYKELIRITSTSSVFDKLLNRPFRMLHQLNTSIFPHMLRTFQSVNIDPGSRNVARTLGAIDERMSSFSLDELNECLITLKMYSLNEMAPPSLRWLLNKVLNEAKNRITDANLKNESSESIVKMINLLNNAVPGDWKVNRNQLRLTSLLLDQLGAENLKLEFKTAVSLLRSLKLFCIMSDRSNEKGYEKADRPFIIPDSYGKLVDRCNLIIYEDLTIDGSDEKFEHFLQVLHLFSDPTSLKFPKFYEYKLLSILSCYLVNGGLNKINDKYALTMALNYSRFNTYDEKLMKLLYDRALTDEKFRRQTNPVLVFDLFSKIDFPFLNLQKLTEALFTYPKKYERELLYKDNILKVLTALILNDIHHDDLYKFICKELDHVNLSHYRSVRRSLSKRCFLAYVYLNSFSTLEPNMKRFVHHKMKMVTNNLRMANRLVKINYTYFDVNQQLQHQAYLSNDIYVSVFGIYDKSIGGLISLENYMDLFTKIDTIPLTEHQQLVAFVEIPLLKGNIDKCELLEIKSMKKILNSLNIKLLQVYYDDIKDRTVEEKIHHFEQAVLDSYKNDDN